MKTLVAAGALISAVLLPPDRSPRSARVTAMIQVAPENDPFVKVYLSWIDSLEDPNTSLDTSVIFHVDSLPKIGQIVELTLKGNGK